MLDWQEDRCAICGGRYRRGLVTDHDHRSGIIRGRLCRGCNALEGFGYGGVFAKYRAWNPATIWGVRQIYTDPAAAGKATPFPGYDKWHDNPMKKTGL